MEPLDGCATLTALREALGTALAPALLVTAYDDLSVRRSAAEAGFEPACSTDCRVSL